MLYIAKPDTWFKSGTVVTLIDDYRKDGWTCGLFEGTRVCLNPGSESHPLGEERIDQEICSFDEFEELKNG